MLRLLAADGFSVGNAPEQVRRMVSVGVGGRSDTLLRSVTDGLEQNGESFMESDHAKRLFRNSTRFSNDVQRPKTIIGSRMSKGSHSYLSDYRDIYRLTMFLEKEPISTRSSSVVQYVVSGYTDRVCHRGNRVELDEDMIFHITNVVMLRVDKSSGLGGRSESNYALLSSNSYIVHDTVDRNKEWTLVPSDLTLYTEEYDSSNESFTTQIYGNGCGGGIAVNHGVTAPDTYLRSAAIGETGAIINRAAVLGNEAEGARASTSALYTQVDGGDLYAYSGNTLARHSIERGIENDDFYMTLQDSIDPKDTDNIEMMRGECCITLGAMMRACGINARDIDRYVSIEVAENEDYDSERWGGCDYNTMSAYEVCHRIPVIMSDNLMKGVSFAVSNLGRRSIGRNDVEFRFMDDYDSGGRRTYAIKPISGVGHLDKFFINKFEDTIIDEVFNHLTENGSIRMEMVVHSTLSGLTRVEIRHDDERDYTPYTFTSFLENRLSSNVSEARDRSSSELIRSNSELRTRLRIGINSHNARQWDTVQDPIRPNAGRPAATSSLADLLKSNR